MPVGYIDARVKGRDAELLGIYLEKSARQKRLGRHVLRWALAALRDRGCRQVRVEIYSDNAASQAACLAAGFIREPRRDRREGRRTVLRYVRRTLPFVSFRIPDTRLSALQGNNIYLHHLAIAEALSDRLMDVPGVLAVLGLGSLWRRFADDMSDIDIAILADRASLAGLRPGERFVVGTSLDVFAVDIDRSPPSSWARERRQAFEESVVMGSRENLRLRDLRSALRLKPLERRVLIGECLLLLGWIGYHPPPWTDRWRYGYLWEVPHDVWLRRGSLESAHATVDKALDLTLQLLFLANCRHVPDAKWRLFLAPGLPWTPRSFRRKLRSVIVAPRNVAGFEVRAHTVRQLVGETANHLERQGAIDENVYARFLSLASDYAFDR